MRMVVTVLGPKMLEAQLGGVLGARSDNEPDLIEAGLLLLPKADSAVVLAVSLSETVSKLLGPSIFSRICPVLRRSKMCGSDAYPSPDCSSGSREMKKHRRLCKVYIVCALFAIPYCRVRLNLVEILGIASSKAS